MAVTFRPRDHADRDRCIAALDPLVGAPLPPRLSSALDLVYVPARDAYLAAREAYDVAAATAKSTGEAKMAAQEAFVAAFRPWVGSVRDARGKTMPREIEEHLGVLPGNLPFLPSREIVTRASRLLTQIPLRPKLSGDAEDLDRVKATLAVFETATTADESTARQKSAAVADYNQATATFDSEWMDVVEAIEKVSPEDVKALLPRFVVSTKKAGKGAKGKAEPQKAPAGETATSEPAAASAAEEPAAPLEAAAPPEASEAA